MEMRCTRQRILQCETDSQHPLVWLLPSSVTVGRQLVFLQLLCSL